MQSRLELPLPKPLNPTHRKPAKHLDGVELTFQLKDGTADGRVFRKAESGHITRSWDELRRMIYQLAGGQAQKK